MIDIMQRVEGMLNFLYLLLERLKIEFILGLDAKESKEHKNMVFISEELLETIELVPQYQVSDVSGLFLVRLFVVFSLEGGEGDSLGLGLAEDVGASLLGVLVVVEELVGYLVGLVGVLVEGEVVVLGGGEGVVHVVRTDG